VLAVAGIQRRQLTYANAGHPHAFLVRLKAVPSPDSSHAARWVRARREERGTAVRGGQVNSVLFTTGLRMRVGPTAERFGEQRVLSHVEKPAGRPARHILEAGFTDIAAVKGGAPANDDRPLVL